MTGMSSGRATDSGNRVELVSIERLAEMLDVSKRTVQRLMGMGKLPPAIRVGVQWRWRLSDVLEWIDAGCPTPRETKLKRGA
uniref:DNA-binding protein n=1 Tax=Schlesneria paludicola TaxID=360056 RepID=A0A7C2P0J8_9PLAN